IFLGLLLAGITFLFLALSFSLVYTRVQNGNPPIQLPGIFVFNTLILIGSSLTLMWAKKSYLNDHTENYTRALQLTIGLTLFFLIAQSIGWYQLFQQESTLEQSNALGYLYLISFVHFGHVIAGLPFLILFVRTAKRRMVEPVSVLVYFSDPEKKLKLKLLTIYWHFLDVLWIYLVLFFWINYLVR
ncbi:MAG: cytochrome c oxidase subunit III, partial [Saprospiraceae bacterium]|nr:cytochrome c oxidase subunit III [Saprospiraceae bacterium]